MATEQEQLIEIRKAYIVSKLQGKTEAQIKTELKYLDIMSFTSHKDFTTWADDLYGTPSAITKEVSEKEMDDIMSHLMPGSTKHSKQKSAAETEMDNIMRNIGL